MDRTPAEEARDTADRRAREMQNEALKQLDGLPLTEQATRIMRWLAHGRIWRDVAAGWAEARAKEVAPDRGPGVEWALERIIRFDARMQGDAYLFTPTDMSAWLTEFERSSAGGSAPGSNADR